MPLKRGVTVYGGILRPGCKTKRKSIVQCWELRALTMIAKTNEKYIMHHRSSASTSFNINADPVRICWALCQRVISECKQSHQLDTAGVCNVPTKCARLTLCNYRLFGTNLWRTFVDTLGAIDCNVCRCEFRHYRFGWAPEQLKLCHCSQQHGMCVKDILRAIVACLEIASILR